MKIRIGLWILFIAFCYAAGGCQESNTQSDRRAQLVGHENIQLKKQIQDKDREIERLQDEIKQLEKKLEDEAAKQGETYKKLLDIIADLTQKLEACQAGQAVQP